MFSIVKAAISAAVKLIPNFVGDRSNREEFQYKAQAAAMKQLAAEFRTINRTPIDVVVDAFNRMIRPVIVAHIFASFWYLVLDPVGFGILMAKLALAPEWYTVILSGVILFWFGARPFEKAHKNRFDAKKFMEALQVVKEMEKEGKYSEELKDTSKPMSNEAIMEWNKRNNEGVKNGGD